MPSQLDVEKIRHTNGTVALEVESTGNMILQKDLKFGSIAAIRDSSGNPLIEESNGSVTLSNIRLFASGGIQDSSGNNILTESGGVVSLSNATLQSTCDVRNANGGIPSGSKMLFQQTTAPVGWTKDTTHNNKALRIVSGTVGTGGNVGFSTAFASQNVGDTTLSINQIPSHTHAINNVGNHGHTLYMRYGGFNGNWDTNRASASANGHSAFNTNGAIAGAGAATINAGNAGNGGSHNHSMDLTVQYVDFIIATKD